jgi:hypothetical protein
MVSIMRMKSWESPRRGRQRNIKSQQASARLRQLKKRNQQLRQRLKSNELQPSKTPGHLPGVFVEDNIAQVGIAKAGSNSWNSAVLRYRSPKLG